MISARSVIRNADFALNCEYSGFLIHTRMRLKINNHFYWRKHILLSLIQFLVITWFYIIELRILLEAKVLNLNLTFVW